jgi:UDP-2,3-diacylglucosamine pyrophosphatase LpxH
MEVQLVINDLHIPFQDDEAVELILKFGKNLHPDKLFILGDFVDMYSISHFSRDPERVTNLKPEFEQGKRILDLIVNTINAKEVIFTEGNHEDRLRKFLWNNPVIHGLISMEDKLGVNDLGIKYYEYGKNYIYKNKLIYTHGNKVNKYSAYTAKNMMDDLGLSVISGHTHRLGTHYRTDYGGAKIAVENGCLCSISLAHDWFRKEVIDWQLGLSVIKWVEDRFNIHQICVPKDKFIIYGKFYYEL